jgi:hypothetical protein
MIAQQQILDRQPVVAMPTGAEMLIEALIFEGVD